MQARLRLHAQRWYFTRALMLRTRNRNTPALVAAVWLLGCKRRGLLRKLCNAQLLQRVMVVCYSLQARLFIRGEAIAPTLVGVIIDRVGRRLASSRQPRAWLPGVRAA